MLPFNVLLYRFISWFVSVCEQNHCVFPHAGIEKGSCILPGRPAEPLWTSDPRERSALQHGPLIGSVKDLRQFYLSISSVKREPTAQGVDHCDPSASNCPIHTWECSFWQVGNTSLCKWLFPVLLFPDFFWPNIPVLSSCNAFLESEKKTIVITGWKTESLAAHIIQMNSGVIMVSLC